MATSSVDNSRSDRSNPPDRSQDAILADAIEAAVQAFGTYFNLKVGAALSSLVRTEVAQALQKTLAGQMAVDINEIIKREIQARIELIRSQIKVNVSLDE